MKFGIDKSELGWEVTYDGLFAPEGTVYATKGEAREACEHAAAESRAWNARGLADAPHLDAF